MAKPTKYRYRVLALLFSLSIIGYLDRICIAVAGPRIQEDLRLSPEQWGWVLGAFSLSYALFEIPTGVLGDRIGARKVLTRIVIWWSTFTTLTGLVPSYRLLLLTRFVFGAGEAGAYPNTSLSISRWFPAVERARAQGFIWMASRVGAALTPLLVVPIQQRWGWRASFWVFGVLGLVWAAVWYWWYRDHPSEKSGVSPTEIAQIDDLPAISSRHSLPWRTALRNANFWTIILMYSTYCWGMHFYVSWLHTYLQKGRGLSEDEMKFVSMLPFIAGGFANLLGGFLSDHLVRKHGLKWGRRIVGTMGLTVAAGSLLVTAVTTSSTAAIVFLTLGFAGGDCMLPVAWAVCLDVGKKYTGAVTGTMNMAGQIAAFSASISFGYMVTLFNSYSLPLIPMSAMLMVSALLFLKIDATRKIVSEPVVAGLTPVAAGPSEA